MRQARRRDLSGGGRAGGRAGGKVGEGKREEGGKGREGKGRERGWALTFLLLSVCE